jgi:hypothetical protein
MSSTDTSGWPRLDKPDTSNATYIDWKKTDDRDRYDPDETWDDDRYPRRYGDYYKHLDEYNGGLKNYKYRNDDYYGWLENDRLISAISCQLDLTKWERARAKGIFHQLQLGDTGMHKENFAVPLCLYVIEKDERDTRRGHPNVLKKWQFHLISTTLGVGKKIILSNYGKIEYRVRVGKLKKAKQFDKYRKEDMYSPESDPIEYEHAAIEAYLHEAAG